MKPTLHARAGEATAGLVETISTTDGARLAVFGSAVRSDFRPDASDINVLIALPEASAATLEALAPALRDGWRRHRVAPYIVRLDELSRLADTFPIRVLDTQRWHVMLVGDDPLEDVDVERSHLRLRVEQELRNRLVRTRRRLIQASDDHASLEHLAVRTARTLRLELWALLVVYGHEPESADHGSVFAAASKHLELDETALEELESLASERAVSDPVATIGRLLSLLESAVRLADRAEAS